MWEEEFSYILISAFYLLKAPEQRGRAAAQGKPQLPFEVHFGLARKRRCTINPDLLGFVNIFRYTQLLLCDLNPYCLRCLCNVTLPQLLIFGVFFLLFNT